MARTIVNPYKLQAQQAKAQQLSEAVLRYGNHNTAKIAEIVLGVSELLSVAPTEPTRFFFRCVEQAAVSMTGNANLLDSSDETWTLALVDLLGWVPKSAISAARKEFGA